MSAAKSAKRKSRDKGAKSWSAGSRPDVPASGQDPSALDRIPITYQALTDYYSKLGTANPFSLRRETFLRIERTTGIPLICYVARTHNLATGVPAYIDGSDLIAFNDLLRLVQGQAVDIFLVSNGGSAKATDKNDSRIEEIVGFFASYDIQKSHGRSIDRRTARELGLRVVYTEDIPGLSDLVCSLYNQYELWFDKTPFFKVFEDARGTNWGRQSRMLAIQLPPTGAPELPLPGPPEPSG